MRRAALAALALLLAACGAPSVPPGPPVPAPGEDTCGASPYTGLVGRDGTALERVLIMRQVRVIRPGDAISEDLRPARINFVIGGDGSIARIYCG
ncbi:I78 family peptidase inhibitor [Histidinibacterium aquaticum]|uniref:Peptidase inhibitor I78 family protein n=1 Tax=Histidinibacterium aquaticum TaxID=2613962 RepID=A0A5J5GFX2_9RHOB|nr:I78 family peptidase inhibitor [Histidinibacterium aquaticum]KAA9006987.1 hypothetical protein F3S47_14575 [Histidinibacterium aquaticum]